MTFGTSAGSLIFASVGAGVAAGSISAGTTSVALGQAVFSNSNNITFGLNGSTLTASASFSQTATPIAAGTQQATAGVSFVNSNGITFGMSNSSDITASFNGLTSQSNQAASASNGSFTFQTLGFSNANGVTFGTSAGSIITASVGTAAAGNSVNFSAGTTSNNLNSIVFSNANGISFGLNGSTITASLNSAAGAIILNEYEPVSFYNATTSSALTVSSKAMSLHRFSVFG